MSFNRRSNLGTSFLTQGGRARHTFFYKDIMTEKNDQVEAMDIVQEDEETKQKRLYKETVDGIERKCTIIKVELMFCRYQT